MSCKLINCLSMQPDNTQEVGYVEPTTKILGRSANSRKKQQAEKHRTKQCLLAGFLAFSFLISTISGPVLAAADNKDKPQPRGTLLLPLSPMLGNTAGNKGDHKPNPLSQLALPSLDPGSEINIVPVTTTKDGQRKQGQPIKITSSPAGPQITTGKSTAKVPAQSLPSRASTPQAPAARSLSASNKTKAPLQAASPARTSSLNLVPEQPKLAPPEAGIKPVPEALASEHGILEDGAEIEEDTMLKGTVQIVADDTEYDQDKNTFLGTGNAVATIAGQNSRLEADMILYDQNSQTIDARGAVKIIRDGMLSTGSSFKFKVTSDEYMITNPDTEIQGTTVVARKAMGTREGLVFKQGTLNLPEPVVIAKGGWFGPLSAAETSAEKLAHPDAYMPAKPSFRFKARKMVYERYKESGNLTIFGGKMQVGNFDIPLGKLTATVGKENRVVMPITPYIGNNIQSGGVNIGAHFNYNIGKTGVFSWAPLLQLGGRNTSGDSDSGQIGAGAHIRYTSSRLSTQLAYGSVSNLLVADLRYQIHQNTHLQMGINRFLNDGLFGSRRARLAAEAVDFRGITGLPYVSSVSFRTGVGWFQDQPSLLNLTPDYKELFTTTGSNNRISGFRLSEQLMAISEPVFSFGNRKYGTTMNLFGGVAARAYSSGDGMLMGQLGPILNVNLNRVRLQGGYTQSGVRGQSPFVFDQFIQGQRSAQIAGDVKVCKWLTVGANLGYNLDAKMLYQRGLTAAIGPEDFKILLSRDTIRGMNRFGFDFMYGAPIPYQKLVLKNRPDQGQIGGI